MKTAPPMRSNRTRAMMPVIKHPVFFMSLLRSSVLAWFLPFDRGSEEGHEKNRVLNDGHHRPCPIASHRRGCFHQRLQQGGQNGGDGQEGLGQRGERPPTAGGSSPPPPGGGPRLHP